MCMTLIAWSTTATDNGYVAPDAFSSADIICHRGAKNAKGHAKETLKFFKIDEVGLVKAGNPGTYGSDELIANDNGWLVQIPENIKAGAYVLRHQIIALHGGFQEDGAQNYPQCFNLEIEGSGTEQPKGILGTELYKPDDKGIKFDIYSNPTSYAIPGPALTKGAVEVTQGKLAEKSQGTPTTDYDSGSDSGSGSGSAAPATPSKTEAPVAGTPAAAPVETSSAAQEPSTPVQTSAPATPKPAKTGCKSKRSSKKARRHARDLMN
uniref:lytic cellulose monooxygenase (C4-dehydrogenating) n=1 Tax=Fusarium oxysporum (strain Fo5176) TaxID=660025 RepID=A0A0D2YI01_FUSOF